MSEAAQELGGGPTEVTRVEDAEQRAATRYSLLIRPAKIVCDDLEYPCVIRDISETGISIKCFNPLPEAARYAIEMLCGARHSMRRVWHEDFAAGFHFDEPIDVPAVLAGQGPFPNRPIRLSLNVPAILTSGLRRSRVELANISQQGARMMCNEHLAVGQMVKLKSEIIPEIHAKVRWRQDCQYGVVFEETFKLAELSELAVRIHGSFAFVQAQVASGR